MRTSAIAWADDSVNVSCIFGPLNVDAAGEVMIRRQLKRRYVLAFFQKLSPCLVGIEACAWSHHWSRQIKALRCRKAEIENT